MAKYSKDKRIKLNRISVFIVFLISITGYISSCNKESVEWQKELLNTESKSMALIEEKPYSLIHIRDWRKQLDKIINNPPSILTKSAISLLEYKVMGRVEDSKDEIKYRNMIESNMDMFPTYSGDFKTIKAVSKNEAISQHSEYQKFTSEHGNNFLRNLNLEGAEILSLKWNNNGVESNTICAVSDKDGILYDNLISNTFILNDPIISSTDDLAHAAPRLKSSSEGSDYDPGTYEWTLTHDAYWLWGSERGEVKITHQGTFNSSGFVSHNFNASHYISIGNSDAKVTEVNNRTIAYGYGMSTPFVSITLTYSGGNYNLSFSSTLGSTLGGTGQHAF